MWIADDISWLWATSLIGAALVGYIIARPDESYRRVFLAVGLLLIVGSLALFAGQNRRATEQLAIAGHFGDARQACLADLADKGEDLSTARWFVRTVRATYGAPKNASRPPLWPWQWEGEKRLKQRLLNHDRRNLHLQINFLVGAPNERNAVREIDCTYDIMLGLADAEASRTQYQVCMQHSPERQFCSRDADRRDGI